MEELIIASGTSTSIPPPEPSVTVPPDFTAYNTCMLLYQDAINEGFLTLLFVVLLWVLNKVVTPTR